MTKQEADFIGSMNMCDEISNEAYKKIMCNCEVEESQPCEDCISIQVVKDMLTAEWTKYMPMEMDVNLSFILDKINELPSVTPQQKWIPCSERLPKKGETEVLITLKEDGSVLQATYLDDRTFDTEAYGWFAIKDIAAWMPLPKSYEESEDAK